MSGFKADKATADPKTGKTVVLAYLFTSDNYIFTIICFRQMNRVKAYILSPLISGSIWQIIHF
tara:strand:+ start:1011 stop:1199 length:189 start_codon:yes stop_codon:yes gene_type:complete